MRLAKILGECGRENRLTAPKRGDILIVSLQSRRGERGATHLVGFVRSRLHRKVRGWIGETRSGLFAVQKMMSDSVNYESYDGNSYRVKFGKPLEMKNVHRDLWLSLVGKRKILIFEKIEKTNNPHPIVRFRREKARCPYCRESRCLTLGRLSTRNWLGMSCQLVHLENKKESPVALTKTGLPALFERASAGIATSKRGLYLRPAQPGKWLFSANPHPLCRFVCSCTDPNIEEPRAKLFILEYLIDMKPLLNMIRTNHCLTCNAGKEFLAVELKFVHKRATAGDVTGMRSRKSSTFVRKLKVKISCRRCGLGKGTEHPSYPDSSRLRCPNEKCLSYHLVKKGTEYPVHGALEIGVTAHECRECGNIFFSHKRKLTAAEAH